MVQEKEKQVELERQQHEQHKAEEAARAEAERVKKEAEEAEKAKKAEEEARINAQKEKEMEEMQASTLPFHIWKAMQQRVKPACVVAESWQASRFRCGLTRADGQQEAGRHPHRHPGIAAA